MSSARPGWHGLTGKCQLFQRRPGLSLALSPVSWAPAAAAPSCSAQAAITPPFPLRGAAPLPIPATQASLLLSKALVYKWGCLSLERLSPGARPGIYFICRAGEETPPSAPSDLWSCPLIIPPNLVQEGQRPPACPSSLFWHAGQGRPGQNGNVCFKTSPPAGLGPSCHSLILKSFLCTRLNYLTN